jgi:hypothetical protein
LGFSGICSSATQIDIRLQQKSLEREGYNSDRFASLSNYLILTEQHLSFSQFVMIYAGEYPLRFAMSHASIWI